jgi:hypothetical protein
LFTFFKDCKRFLRKLQILKLISQIITFSYLVCLEELIPGKSLLERLSITNSEIGLPHGNGGCLEWQEEYA